jgi:hypothetical protein
VRLALSLIAALALVTAAATVVTAVARPASALGATGAYHSVLHAYERENQIPACQFSTGQLQSALQDVDTYGAQYFADFTQAIQDALNTRASGACSAQASVTKPASSPRRPFNKQPLARFPALTAATSAGIPAPLAVLAALATGLGLFAAGATVRRVRRRTR